LTICIDLAINCENFDAERWGTIGGKRRVTHTAITSLPIEFRPALLAGLARVSADPAVLHDLQKATLPRGQRNFDKFCREANFELRLAQRLSHQ